MDGNRGAKGSIKDRLISLLYRLRYAKRVKKEDEYTIAKKEKQAEYLKSLIDLKENENIDVLDSNDKRELDKINFVATYKISNESFSLNKKGIGEIDFDLTDIEIKTNELDSKVELKEEIKKTKNEIVILKEVEDFVKKGKQTLEEISNEVTNLKKLSKEKNQDTEELEERYKKLRRKVDKLKEQYDAVKDKYDFSEFSILESIKLIDNITDYKNRASLNEIDMMIKVCKKEMDKIESVSLEYVESKKIGFDIDNIKDDQNKIKIKFHKSKEEIKKLQTFESKINNEIKSHEEIIESMYKEAAYFEKITKTEIEYSGYGKMFGALLNIAGGVLTLPFTGSKIFGVALGNTMINRGLKTLNKGLNVKEKVVTDYKYTDIAHKISKVKDKVEYTNLIVSDNLNEIVKLRENLKKYNEYNKVLPEYESILKKMDNLESKLKIQQQRLTNMDKELDNQKQINKEKMKKVTKLKESSK